LYKLGTVFIVSGFCKNISRTAVRHYHDSFP